MAKRLVKPTRNTQLSAGAAPLVGRAEELELIRGLRTGRRRASAVVVGPLGVGKSRLARSALDAAEHDGWATLAIRATAGLSTVPLAAFRAVLPASSATSLFELVDVVGQQLIASRSPKGLFIVVDDGQFLDEASAALIHQLVAAKRLQAVITIRSDEGVPAAVTSLWTEGLAERIVLQNLSRGETSDLLASALGGTVQTLTAERIWHVTKGNPLYVRELIQSSLEVGAMRNIDGEWSLRGKWATGSRIQEVVSSRVGRLDPDAFSALEALALAGSLPLGLLTELTSDAAIELLEARSLVVTTLSGRRTEVSIAHPLHAEVLRSGMLALRQRSMWRTLVDALRDTGARRSADRVRLACWSIEAGLDVDPVTLATGADASLVGIGHAIAARLQEILPAATKQPPGPLRQDRDRAIRLAQAVFARTGSAPDGIALAGALVWNGATDEAEAVLAEVAARVDDSSHRLRLALALAFISFRGRSELERAIALLTDALAASSPDDDPRLVAEVYRDLAAMLLQIAKPAAALEHARLAAAREGVALSASRAAATAAAAMSYLGRCGEAAALIDEALALANREGRTRELPTLLLARVGALARGGDIEQARELVDWLRAVALTDGLLDAAATFGVMLGVTLLRQGRPASAGRVFRDSVGMLAERDILVYRPWALAGLARAKALVGEQHSAQSALDEARRTQPTPRLFSLTLYLAELELHRLAGRTAAALDAARDAVTWARSTEMVIDEAQACDAWLSIEKAAAPAGRLEELAGLTDSKLVGLLARRARARMANDAEELISVGEGFAAITAWAEAARTAVWASEIFATKGLAQRSRVAMRNAERYASRCEALTLPGLERSGSQLTARELEVARLAAKGTASKEIAERMHVSPRTVENHLYRAYMKLGVSDRAGLEEALAPE